MADEKTPPRAAKPAAAKPVAAKPAAVPPPPPPTTSGRVVDDDDDVNPYVVVKETEEEKKIAEKNKPKFTDVKDKFKRSVRGPAQAILVLPTNLLVGQGALCGLVGVLLVIVGVWPLIFTDAPPSDEEIAEQLVTIFMGFTSLTWGSLTCLGASRMQNLESYAWALAGSVLGILPLFAGIFAIMALRDPRVIAGFEEMEGAIDDEGEEDAEEIDDEDDDEEDEDDDEEEEEDEDEDRAKKKTKKK